MESIRNYKELIEKLNTHSEMHLLLYKSSSELSNCAYSALEHVVKAENVNNVFVADVTEVRDIHPEFTIKSVPVLMTFADGTLKNVDKGCISEIELKSIFNNYVKKSINSGKSHHNVTVYSTLSCSWCNTLKSYLRQNGISFRDIDVSKDLKAAEEMVRRSGQQGVPQSVIDGNLVVGFDKNKIDQLLELDKN